MNTGNLHAVARGCSLNGLAEGLRHPIHLDALSNTSGVPGLNSPLGFFRRLFCNGGTIQPSRRRANTRTRVLKEDGGWFPPLTSRK